MSATPIITYSGTNITAQIQPNLATVKMIDSISYKSDSVQIDIQDSDGRFLQVFTFQGAQKIQLQIQAVINGQTIQGNYGSYEIHKMKARRKVSGGREITLYCNSCPVSGSARLEGKSQGFSATTLKTIANQIATQDQMSLLYDVAQDYPIGRSDQKNESDLVLLGRLCESNGLCLKVRNNNLFIFDRLAYEAKPAVGTIYEPTGLNSAGLTEWEFDYSLEDIFAAAQLTHFDPSTGRLIKGTFTDPNNPPVGADYLETGRPYNPSNTDQGTNSSSEASFVRFKASEESSGGNMDLEVGSIDGSQTADQNNKAKHKLHKKNRKGHQIRLTLPLSLFIQSGQNYNLANFGAQLDAKYICTEVTHGIDGKSKGATTLVDLEKCLNYPIG
jgi:phage protein D